MRLILLAPFTLLSGCAALGSHEFAHFNDEKQIPIGKIIIEPSSLHSLVVENGRVCAEAQPDSMFKLGLSGNGQAETKASIVKIKGKGTFSTDGTNLGGRDGAVLFARDAASLLCFLTLNLQITNADVKEMYTQYLMRSVEFAKIESSNKGQAVDQSSAGVQQTADATSEAGADTGKGAGDAQAPLGAGKTVTQQAAVPPVVGSSVHRDAKVGTPKETDKKKSKDAKPAGQAKKVDAAIQAAVNQPSR